MRKLLAACCLAGYLVTMTTGFALAAPSQCERDIHGSGLMRKECEAPETPYALIYPVVGAAAYAVYRWKLSPRPGTNSA